MGYNQHDHAVLWSDDKTDMKAIKIFVMVFCSAAIMSIAGGQAHAMDDPAEIFGYTFPPILGSFTIGDVTDLTKKCRGCGYAVGYESPEATATVYVYDLGIEGLAEGIGSQLATDHFNDVKGALIKANPGTLLIANGMLTLNGMPYLHSRYQFADGSMYSSVYLTVHDGKFIKLSITYDICESINVESDFTEAISEVIKSRP